jgi:hypothetical protein
VFPRGLGDRRRCGHETAAAEPSGLDLILARGAHRYAANLLVLPRSRQFAEIFLGNSRASDSDVDASAKDSAILASYLLTRGQSRFTP